MESADNYYDNLTPECQKWYKTASLSERIGALEIGFQAVKLARGLRPATANQQPLPVVPSVQLLPTRKGQIGESFVQDILEKRYPGAVENMTKTAHSGDITLWLQLYKIVIEIKNYTNAVPTSGISKFQRDLGVTNASGGIFISLNTPISGFREDFLVRYEYTASKIIPTIYIVGNHENIILTAINIVSQLINATDVLIHDVYERDRILEYARDAGSSLDVLSKSRNDLQTNISEAAEILNKSTIGFVHAEVELRRAIDGIRSEIFSPKVIFGGDIENMFDGIIAQKGYGPDVQSLMYRIVRIVETITPKRDLTISAWKSSIRKYVHINSGIGFNMLQNRVEVIIPITRVDWGSIGKLFTIFRDKISIQRDIIIQLDDATVDAIESVIENLGQV